MANEEITVHTEKLYHRFALAARIEHLILLLSFSILGVTGLIQKFPDNAVSDLIFAALGGITNTRLIHHVAAVVLLVLSAYHVIAVLYKIYVRRRSMTMLPGLKDVTDALDLVRYNLGLTKEHPKMPRYNFGEKFEYWAVVWGTVVMAITGFMLWNPILTTQILPGQFIPAAKAAHGGEAVLAVLAILVWHVYNVHLKMFNKSIFTGKMTRHQMQEEHGAELAQIEAGMKRPLPPSEAQRRRERVFLPVALLLAAVSLLAIFWFVTYETTAIATVPPQEVESFSPLTPTPAPSATVDNASLGAPIPHPIEGQEQCSTCHGPDGVKPYPADHVDRPDESCLVCHEPGEATAASEGESIAAEIPHAIEGKEQCSACHGEAGSLVPMPANHIRPVEDATCTLCHKPGAVTEAPAGETAPATGGPAAIPHPIEGAAYADCTVCHGAGKTKPFPENHTAFASDSCTACHQPAAAEATPEAGEATPEPAAGGPAAIPHPIEGAAYAECTVCHGADKAKPFPENHAAFASDSCTTCHKPAEAEATPEATVEPAIEATAAPTATPRAGATATPRAAATATPTGEGASTVGGPKPIPHSILEPGYQDCTVCHGPGKIKPNPPSHEAFPVSACAACHQPQTEQ
jgi:cytochrome b subunit of formate dehydrogenase